MQLVISKTKAKIKSLDIYKNGVIYNLYHAFFVTQDYLKGKIKKDKYSRKEEYINGIYCKGNR